MKTILLAIALLYPVIGYATYEPVYTSQSSSYQAQVITAISPNYIAGWKNAYLHKQLVDDLDNVQFVVLNDPRAEFYDGLTKKMVSDDRVKVIVKKNILNEYSVFNSSKIVCTQEIRQVAGGILGVVLGFLEQIQVVIQFVQDVIGFLKGDNVVQIKQAVAQCESYNY